jgi:hypothetical protein
LRTIVIGSPDSTATSPRHLLQLFVAVAKQVRVGAVAVGRTSIILDHRDANCGRVEHRAQPLVGLVQVTGGLALQGHVLDRADHARRR